MKTHGPVKHPDGLLAAKLVGEVGRCLFCEELVRAGRVRCDEQSCEAAYYRCWHRDAAVVHPERYRRRRAA